MNLLKQQLSLKPGIGRHRHLRALQVGRISPHIRLAMLHDLLSVQANDSASLRPLTKHVRFSETDGLVVQENCQHHEAEFRYHQPCRIENYVNLKERIVIKSGPKRNTIVFIMGPLPQLQVLYCEVRWLHKSGTEWSENVVVGCGSGKNKRLQNKKKLAHFSRCAPLATTARIGPPWADLAGIT